MAYLGSLSAHFDAIPEHLGAKLVPSLSVTESKCPPTAKMSIFPRVFNDFRARPDLILGPLGAILGSSWALLGAILGHSGPIPGPSWASKQAYNRCERYTAYFGVTLDLSWGHSGAILGSIGVILGRSGAILKLLWGYLGAIPGHFGASLVPSWINLKPRCSNNRNINFH